MKNRKALGILALCFVFIGALFISGCHEPFEDPLPVPNPLPFPVPNPLPVPNFGVVVLSGGWIGILDGATQALTTPLLVGELGTTGSQILDVAISPDGKTTLVSNFSEKTVFFIDTSDPTAPVISGNVTLSFSAEDIAITPDGRYALVTNGGFSSKIGVLDLENIRLVEEGEFGDPLLLHAAVAVAPDGETVLTIDYSGGLLHAFTLDANGHLDYVNSTDVSNGDTLKPINIAISPDGKTVVLASRTSNDAVADMAFTLLTITGPGQVAISDLVRPSINITSAQSAVFNQYGSKVYLSCVQKYVAPVPEPDPPVMPNNVIVVLNVIEPGKAIDAGTPFEVDFNATSQLFGVDTLAIDNRKNLLYVSNMNISQQKTHVQVVDLATQSVIKTYPFDPVTIGEPPVDTDSIPAGVAIWNP